MNFTRLYKTSKGDFCYLIPRAGLLIAVSLLKLIKWQLVSVLKIEKCRHTDAKNSKLGSKNKEPFFLEGGYEEKE